MKLNDYAMIQKKNILIVDDNQINLQVVSSFLKEQNYNIAVALDGFDAIKILKDTQIDLIVMDVMMPQMDGFETCKRIKEEDSLKDIPIIFLTAKTQTKDIIEGFQAGGVDYVTKPFNGEELIMRIKTHLELADAKQTIVQFHKTRDRIYSILAHDIRSPLASISMLLDGLAGKYIDSSGPNFDKLISEISLSTRNTLTLIQNILEWTKTQSDTIALCPEIIDVQMIVERSISLLALNFQEKKIQLHFSIPYKSEAYIDEVTVSNIFRNLISNAIKFTNTGGVISVSSFEDDKYLNICIQDSGKGMSPQIIEKIFERDEHYTCRGTNNEKGTGLGLYMVKDFVKLNKGKLHVESEIDKGTTFTISLPKFEIKTL